MSEKLLIKYSDVELCQQELVIFKNVNIEVYSGEFIYLLGAVGSGKSTFLKSLYYEVPIETGEAEVLGYNLRKMKTRDVAKLRRKTGIVFQDFKLLHDRNVFKNLVFVLRATGWKDKKLIKEQIDNVLKQVGMANKGYKFPHQLSGGEQQRIVIARALLNSPEIILADEPTGNLDPTTGKEIIELLYKIRLSGTTIIVATHNHKWIDMYAGRVLQCENEQMTEIADVKKEVIEEEGVSE